jgi:hypothetical protein
MAGPSDVLVSPWSPLAIRPWYPYYVRRHRVSVVDVAVFILHDLQVNSMIRGTMLENNITN